MSREHDRLTRRPLPEHDPHIETLDGDTRRELGAIWAERASSELRAGSGFALLVTELYAIGADTTVLRLATRAAHDEVRHAELCRRVAEAYLGEEVAPPRAKRVAMPEHDGADETLRAHLHVIGLCCINETLAAGFVEACLEHTQAPLVRAVQREHLADEVEHARVGWAHLASDAVSSELKGELSSWLPRLLRSNLGLWKQSLTKLPEQGAPAHGYPPRAELLQALDTSLREVILPGFRHVEVPVTSQVA